MVRSIHLRRGAASRAGERVAFVDRYTFPAAALAAFQQAHQSDLDDYQRAQLIAGTRQWCRLLARGPRANLEQPSCAVADHWRYLRAGAEDHLAFCAGAFGGIPRQTGTPTGPPPEASARRTGLHATYLMACSDENAIPPHLPLLFRIDWSLDRLDARTYMPNCGEVRYCAAGDGAICLQHVATAPRGRLSRWDGAPAGGIGTSFSDAEGGYAGWGRR